MSPRPCPACGATRHRAAMRVGEHRFLRCRSCATLHVADPPPPAAVASLYADRDYFENPGFASSGDESYCGYLDYLEDREHIEQKFSEIVERIESWREPGRLLDVGAGPGLLLAAASGRGWQATGLDLNPWAVRFGRDELGLDLREGTLAEAGFEPAAFDAVTMMDLIEHVDDPAALVAEAARLLRRDGIIAILTPNAGSLTSRMLRGRWPEARRAPEHLVLFSVDGLRAMLGRHGLEPLAWHSIGKTSSVATLLADVSPIAPAIGRPLQRLLADTRIGRRTFELDPRTKFCLYARRV